jgi:hypothetical protein
MRGRDAPGGRTVPWRLELMMTTVGERAMRGRAIGLVTACVLLGLLAGCGYEPPEGTLTAEQVSDQAKAQESTDLEGVVTCQSIRYGEKETTWAKRLDDDFESVATVFDLDEGKGSSSVESSVWQVDDPKDMFRKLAWGIDDCAEGQPEYYSRIDSVPGFPDALGYEGLTQKGHLRRIFVPIDGHIVVVGALRTGRKTFAVQPEDLLKDAVAEAKKLD